MPSLLIYRLCGIMITDSTMAGTSMMTDIRNRSFSDEILEKLDLDPEIFPPFVEAGTMVGRLKPDVASEMGLPAELPLISAGHDTQFALFGSGAGRNQPVLSSGTWEILMARVPEIDFSRTEGITTEFDVLPGLYNPGIMWIASGVLEWLAGLLFPDLKNDPERYRKMIEAAERVPAGCDGLRLSGTLTGSATLSGLSHTMGAGHLYRAALEAFSFNCREGLQRLEKTCGFKASSLICVGGGSRNSLWNQIRADVLGIPVHISDRTEATALGAAMFALTGAGIFSSPEEAATAWEIAPVTIMPGHLKDTYSVLYHAYEKTLSSLKKS